MRAEVTGGLDLKSLENLRIYNGYETEKSRKLSSEASSADDNENDTGLGEWIPSKEKFSRKCGRPANPIPRHKRDSHIKAEYKRRDKIQKGFESLLTIVPELTNVSEKESKTKILFKTANYCRQLKSECWSTQKELTALRQELESIGTEIQELQDKLPKNGVDTVKNCEDVAMDTLYDQYVKDETKKNWKFWIFRFFIHPLYESFKQVTSGKQDSQEFNKNVFQWIHNCLSLGNLRKGFLESFRTISKCTSIMTNPEQLKLEATSNTHDNFVGTRQDRKIANPANTMTKKGPTADLLPFAECSTVQTSTSPPRTPNVLKRSSRREIQRSSCSRSRSNSPTQAETKSKRPSNYRSRSGRRIGDDHEENGEYAKPVGNPNIPLLSQLLPSPHFMQTTQYRAATGEDAILNANYEGISEVPPISQSTMNTLQNKLSFNINVVESPNISVGTSVDIIIPEPVTESQFTTPDVCNVSPSVTTNMITEPVSTVSAAKYINNYSSNKSKLVNLYYLDTSSNESFAPSSSSCSISNSSLVSQSGLHVDSYQTTSSTCCKIQPADLFLKTTDSDYVYTEMPSLTNAMFDQSSSHIYSESFGKSHNVGACTLDTQSPDEDSLLGHLSFDVMDVGTVMKFFNDNKHTQS